MQSCNVSQCDTDALPSLTKCHTPRREPETQRNIFTFNAPDAIFVNLVKRCYFFCYANFLNFYADVYVLVCAVQSRSCKCQGSKLRHSFTWTTFSAVQNYIFFYKTCLAIEIFQQHFL